jgi:hypothetical protein
LKINVHGPDRGDLLAWHYTFRSAYQLAVQSRDREKFSYYSSSRNPSGNRSLWSSI